MAAAVEIPMTQPHFSANADLTDNSKIDDSFKQQGTTVNLGAGATYNQNCGNKHEMSRKTSMIMGMVFSFICDLLVIGVLLFFFMRFDRESKEGIRWMLRNDIIKSIDIHEASKTISLKSFRRIEDQYNYYHAIGGNHDVEGRFNDFKAKIRFGEIKTVQEDFMKK